MSTSEIEYSIISDIAWVLPHESSVICVVTEFLRCIVACFVFTDWREDSELQMLVIGYSLCWWILTNITLQIISKQTTGQKRNLKPLLNLIITSLLVTVVAVAYQRRESSDVLKLNCHLSHFIFHHNLSFSPFPASLPLLVVGRDI